MAGHSKWANIRFRKSAQDAKRSKIFTKLIRELTVLSRMGGPDPAINHRLRDAVARALKANMKRDTVEKAIARGSGTSGDKYFEILYEGYGPHGVAILIECMTDNKNRTVAEIRHSLSKYGGSLGTDGSVAYLFDKIGVLYFSLETDMESLMDAAIDAGADDVNVLDENIEVSVPYQELTKIAETLASLGFDAESLDVVMKPQIDVSLEGEAADKVVTLLEVLDGLDDVQQVYTNAAFSEIDA